MIKLVAAVLWFLCGMQIIVSITVSPDFGLRNRTQYRDTPQYNGSQSEKEFRLIDRYRRLIPYMTFYVPTNIPINEYFNNLSQIKAIAAPGSLNNGYQVPVQPHLQEGSRLQSQVQQSGGGRPINYNHPRYPNSRPNYHSIFYNTRHETANQDNIDTNRNQIHHQQQIEQVPQPAVPLKEAEMQLLLQRGQSYQQHSAPKQAVTPFTSTNKLPGQFTPIIYTETEDGLKPQTVMFEEYKEMSEREKPQDQQHLSNGPTSTTRPDYTTYEDIPQKSEHLYEVGQEQDQQPQELSPQQKYVAYLQQQIQYQNLRKKSLYQTSSYIDVVSSTAPPPADNQILYNEKNTASHTNEITFPQSSSEISSEEELYNQIPEQPVDQPKQQPNQVVERKPTYLEYLQQQQHYYTPPKEIYNTYKPLMYITTPSTIYVSSSGPSYKTVPIQQHYHPEPIYKIPTQTTGSIRQHLTETTQTAKPIPSTYNPSNYPSSSTQYNSHNAPSRSEKRKHAQRYRPVIVSSPESIETKPDPILVSNEEAVMRQPEDRPDPIFVSRPEKKPDPVFISGPETESDPVFITRPVTKPDPVFISGPETESDPVFITRPGKKPDPVFITRPATKPDPVFISGPETESDPVFITRPVTKPDPVFISRPETKPAPVFLPRPEIKPNPVFIPRPEIRPDPTFKTRTEPRPDPDLKSRLESRPNPILISKPEPQPDTIVVLRPAANQISNSASMPSSIINHENFDPKEANLPDDLASSSLAEILRKLQETNHLPKTLTPDNIDNSIRTLIKILNNLKRTQTIVEDPPQHHEDDYEYEEVAPVKTTKFKQPGPGTGRPGIDYPNLAEIPKTSFSCKEQRYKGFFGDPETSCQVWHYCDLNGGQASFLCPNGTIFSQVALTCDWWFNVKCSNTAQLYVLNERLYKYILPFTPKFPEDYSGPLVDKYLALKFQEMEEKMRRQKLKGKQGDKDESESNDITSSASDPSSKSEESEEDEEPDNSSIDTYSLTEQSTTTECPESHIVVSSSPQSILNNGMPSSTTTYAAISSSESPFADGQSTKSKITVESEKVEVIEIKSDGSSGHLTPSHSYQSKK